LNRLLPLKELLNPSLHLTFNQSRLEVLFHIAGYPLIAILMLSSLAGRLLDAKLSPFYLLPLSLIWIFSTVTLMFQMHYWPIGLALFVFLLIAGGFYPIKPAPVMVGFGNNSAEQSSNTDTSDDKVESRRNNPASPYAFLVVLIILAGLWLPLIYLGDISGHGAGIWGARIGYAILGFFWFGLAASRFKDAGLPYGRLYLYMFAVSTVSLMPLMFNFTNGYESLGIFVLIQIPIALLRSKPSPEEPMTESCESEEDDKSPRDPSEGILEMREDEAGVSYPLRKPEVFTGISSSRSKRTPSWRRF
jgi:hypothetical protein